MCLRWNNQERGQFLFIYRSFLEDRKQRSLLPPSWPLGSFVLSLSCCSRPPLITPGPVSIPLEGTAFPFFSWKKYIFSVDFWWVFSLRLKISLPPSHAALPGETPNTSCVFGPWGTPGNLLYLELEKEKRFFFFFLKKYHSWKRDLQTHLKFAIWPSPLPLACDGLIRRRWFSFVISNSYCNVNKENCQSAAWFRVY